MMLSFPLIWYFFSIQMILVNSTIMWLSQLFLCMTIFFLFEAFQHKSLRRSHINRHKHILWFAADAAILGSS